VDKAAAPGHCRPCHPTCVAAQSIGTPPSDSSFGVRILRPAPLNTPPPTTTLTYRADPRGQFMVTAEVNGAPVGFLVDTGATLVVMTAKDARAAGINLRDLVFNQIVHTSNGPVAAAAVLLREIRVDKLAIHDIRAAVIEKLDQSVLGMSFLSRLQSFQLQQGTLTLYW
jgi:aspartyl protease family protein